MKESCKITFLLEESQIPNKDIQLQVKLGEKQKEEETTTKPQDVKYFLNILPSTSDLVCKHLLMKFA